MPDTVVNELGRWEKTQVGEVGVSVLVEPTDLFRLAYQGAWLSVSRNGGILTALATNLGPGVAEFTFLVDGVQSPPQPVLNGQAGLEIDVSAAEPGSKLIVAGNHPDHGPYAREVEL